MGLQKIKSKNANHYFLSSITPLRASFTAATAHQYGEVKM
jgi:hypothetical protein